MGCSGNVLKTKCGWLVVSHHNLNLSMMYFTRHQNSNIFEGQFLLVSKDNINIPASCVIIHNFSWSINSILAGHTLCPELLIYVKKRGSTNIDISQKIRSKFLLEEPPYGKKRSQIEKKNPNHLSQYLEGGEVREK